MRIFNISVEKIPKNRKNATRNPQLCNYILNHIPRICQYSSISLGVRRSL